MAAKIRATPGPKEFDRLFRVGTLNGCSEAEVLARFVESRDEFAFESMMLRHGPMVLRTCRALLADPNDADDAFQATFLVLSRRAGSIRNAELLGPWLHRVARRVSAKALARSSRRSKHEHTSTDALATLPDRGTPPHPDRAAIHEAIDHLPESYRRVIILCDLEGHSHAEAASRLGCPIGTVKGRQSRARTLLRRRLTRLGLAPAAILSGPLFTLPARAFSVPRALVHRTSRAAAAFAATGALAPELVSTGVLSLTTGVLTGMVATQLKSFALVGLLALGLGTSGLAVLNHSNADDVPGSLPTPANPNAHGVPGVVPTPAQDDEAARPDAPDQHGLDQPDSVPEPDNFLGAWICIESEGVESAPLPYLMEVRQANPGLAWALNRKGRPYLVATQHQPEEGPSETITLLAFVDPADGPGQIDFFPLLSFSSGQQNVPVSRGIYRFDGETLTIHVADEGEARPTGFERDPGKDTKHFVYSKVSVPDEVAGTVPPPAVQAESKNDQVAGLVGTWNLVSRDGGPAIPHDLRLTVSRVNTPRFGPTAVIRSVWTWSEESLKPGESITISNLFQVNPFGSPASWDYYQGISVSPTIGLHGGRGIYRLDGDTLTIRIGERGDPGRPDDFDGPSTMVYARGTDVPEVDTLPAPTVPAGPSVIASEVEADDPLSPLLGTWITTSSTMFGPTVINQGEGRLVNTVIQIRRLEGDPDVAIDPDDPSIPLRMIWEEPKQTKEGDATPFSANRVELIARFDPSSDPPSVTLSNGEKSHSLGIYRLEGDTLILHLGERRPRSWRRDTSGVVRSTLMTLRRLDIDQLLPLVSLDDVRQAISGKSPAERRPTEPPANDSDLDDILARWEQASGKIETLYATFDQIDEMKTVGETRTYEGSAYLKRPDRFLLQLDRKLGDGEGKKAVFDRRILINGERFVEFDGTTRQITVLPLPGDDQEGALEGADFFFRFREGIARSLVPRPQPPIALDLLFGMNAEDSKRRYRIKLLPPIQDDTVRLSLSPKDDDDRDTFSVVVLILDATTLRPRSIHVLAPNGQDKQTFLINELKANVDIKPELFDWKPAMSRQAQDEGWRVIPRSEPEPAQDPLTGLFPLPTPVAEAIPSRADPSPREEPDPRSIDRRLSNLEAKLDRLLELMQPQP